MLSSQSRLHTLLKLKNPSSKERDEILKLLRTGKYDLPECVFEQAFSLLKQGAQPKNRLYQTSQLIHSGLELQIGSKLKGYLKKFRDAIGDVPAIKKLAAFMDYTLSSEPSTDHFDDLIIQDRTNYDSRKQAISSFKALCLWDDYVQALNSYLKENPNDVQAWMELGDLYTERSQYLRALFCYEEVVILSPENDYFFLRLAELYYTDGGKQNLSTAVKYFSYVISRNPQNPRALWGLYRSLHAQKDALDETDQQLMQKTKEAIQRVYNKKNPSIKINLAL